MINEVVKTEITVIGGGLAGVCAAVAAARLGSTVALVQNRPVLGGNSSSEVRVWVCGATGLAKHRYARETGIIGEMILENQYSNIDGNPYYWDLVVLEKVRAEKNIQLFLNTDVHEVEACGDENNRTIQSVTGWMMGSERRIRFESSMYIDCTGDGLVGFLAGAKYRIGREAHHEYQEGWAPETADNITLGSTILFYTKDVGHPVKFVPPSFSKDITKTSIPMNRIIRSGDNGADYWWIEWGGELDTVHENERIRDELQSVIYGVWDYIKNSGKFEADHLTLEWIGSLPGKREYRRFIGDYVLNQNDILGQTPFDDRIAFGGWSIDLHPPEGMYSSENGCKHLYTNGIYHIPFRSLYSCNVTNMLMAGRNISATHVAFGSTRVMATCAIIGEAAGTGAVLSIEKGITPRQLYKEHIVELQQTLLREDASIIGVRAEDAAELAQNAKVSASSTLRRLAIETSVEPYKLMNDVAILIPVEPMLDGFELLVDVEASADIEVELWDTGKAENYVPHSLQSSASRQVNKGEKQWILFDLKWVPDKPQNAFIVIKRNDAICLHRSRESLTGVLIFFNVKDQVVDRMDDAHDESMTAIEKQLVVEWSMNRQARMPFCFRAHSEMGAYRPNKISDGFRRPYGGPHMWVSEPMMVDREEWVELKWEQPVSVKTIYLVFNNDVNEYLNNLHYLRTPFEIFPELVKDYRIEAWKDGEWVMITRETSNRKRKRVYEADQAVNTDRVRVVVESTNGCPRAEIVEVRIYS